MPIFTRSSRSARPIVLSIKLRHERRDAISRTSPGVSYCPCGSHCLSAMKVSYSPSEESMTETRIASLGHAAAQCPQETQVSPVYETLPSTSSRFLKVQTSMHRPQAVQSSGSIDTG